MAQLILKNELTNDPLGRGYAGMTDAQAADNLNTVYRTRQIRSFSGDFMFTKTNPDEFVAIGEHKQLLWLSFCGREVDPWAANNEAFVIWVFGETSVTVANLAGARTENISRAQELGIGNVNAQTIKDVRSL